MKKITVLLFLIIAFKSVLFGQWQVETFNPPYLGSYFISGTSTGWVVCSFGKIRKTTNGGITWENQFSGTNVNLNAVHFVNLSTGWVVGEDGLILYTSNGGANWQVQSSGIANRLLSVHFFNASNGLIAAASSQILRTTNGGVNWSAVTVLGFNQNIQAVQMRSVSLAYGAASGYFIKSTNGGLNWVNIPLTRTASDIQFLDDNTGYASTYEGSVLKTTNAGANWQEYLTGNSFQMNDIAFINSSTGYTGGLEGKIYKSTNSGVNWSLVHTIPGMVEDLSVFNTSQVFACTQGGSTAYLNSAGTTWFNTNEGNSGIIYDMHFINASTGWAVNYYSNLLFTTNGGINWSQGPTLSIQNIQTVYFISSTTGFITGYTETDGASTLTIGKTTNGGTNWLEQSFVSGDALGFQFVNSTDGYVLFKEMAGYKLYKTSNTGANWQPAYTSAVVMNDFYFTTQLNGWMCGNSGTMLKTTNGGVNWASQTTGVTDSLLSVFFINANFGWACGSGGRIIATTNGGTSWQTQTSGTTARLNDVEFGSATTGAIAGNNGTRLVTSSGGATWANNIEISQTKLTEVCFAGGNQVYVGGDLGYISLNSALTAIEPLNNTIPSEFTLKQNYPNPFNPATTIEFSIPNSVSGVVKLIVYDITGRQVSELINSKLNAGNYKINFNASGISSGAYFYKLSSDNYSEIKKLVLIK